MQQPFFGLTRSSGANTLIVVGIPWDATSSYRRGASAGPDAIRRTTDGTSYSHFSERGIDLAKFWRVCDHGNTRKTTRLSVLTNNLKELLRLHAHRESSALFLGGDHYVTYPAFRLTAESRGRPLSLLYLDAHPDINKKLDGMLDSHATVVSRVVENRKISTGKVCYVGIRASDLEQDNRMNELGLPRFTSADFFLKGSQVIASEIKKYFADDPIYLSIDMDCLDPAYAPGVGIPQPGGLSTRQMFNLLQELNGLSVVAADIVEYSPRFDSNARITAFAAAALIKEIMQLLKKY